MSLDTEGSPFAGLPPDIVGEIAKWFSENVINLYFNDIITRDCRLWSYNHHLDFKADKREIVQLNELLWIHAIMCRHAGIPVDTDVKHFLKYTKVVSREGIYNIIMRESTYRYSIRVFSEVRMYKYLVRYNIMTKHLTRSCVLEWMIGVNAYDLFYPYLEIFPEPFTKDELQQYIFFSERRATSRFKYEEFLRQKLKEIMD
jgi:hypothetical protein